MQFCEAAAADDSNHHVILSSLFHLSRILSPHSVDQSPQDFMPSIPFKLPQRETPVNILSICKTVLQSGVGLTDQNQLFGVSEGDRVNHAEWSQVWAALRILQHLRQVNVM